MFNQLSSYIFSILIILIFTSISVYGDKCNHNQKKCSDHSNTWCCPSSQPCGSYSKRCMYSSSSTSTSNPKPSSRFSSALLTMFVILSIFFVVLCVYVITRSQLRSFSSGVTVNPQRGTNPHRQRSIHGPGRIMRVRPVHNVYPAPLTSSLYESPPPEYDVATTDLPPKYESVPVTAMVEQSNF